MGRVILSISTSLDGFIADAQGSIGWLNPYRRPDEDYGRQDLLERVGSLIMGGRTYRQAIGFGTWPYAGWATFVVTHQALVDPPDPAIHAWSDDPTGLATHIRGQSDRDIWLVGGSQTIAPLHRRGMIDEYDIAVVPVTLGNGVRLFGGPAAPKLLRLTGTVPYGNGIVRLRYEIVADDPPSG